jgi:hypothetical protein
MADPAFRLRPNLTEPRVLVLADGQVAWGRGFGAVGKPSAKCASTPP